MIIVQDLTFRDSLFNSSIGSNNEIISQSVYWESIVLGVFLSFVTRNIFELYKSIEPENITVNESGVSVVGNGIRSIQLLYFSVLIVFILSFLVFLVSSVVATYLGSSDIFRWIEFISCIISALFCFIIHVVYFAYKRKFNENNKIAEDKLGNVAVEQSRDFNMSGKISEIIMFALFQFIMVQITSNLLYFNVAINISVNIILIIISQILLIYSTDANDTVICLYLAILVIFYFIQIYKGSSISSALDSMNHVNEFMSIQNTAMQVENAALTSSLADSSVLMAGMSQNLSDIQSQLSQALLSNQSLQGNLSSANASNAQLTSENTALSAYQIQSLTNQLNLNINMLQQQISYFSELQALLTQLQQQFIADSPDVNGNNYFVGYASTIGALSTQANTLLTNAQSLLTNVNSIQGSDISSFNANLSALITNVNFIRSNVYFTVPSSVQTQDSANFNLLYEFGIKVFAHFFRNKYSSTIPWNGNNENVVRDTIMYIKQTPTIYNALSVYSQGVVSELYALMDGNTVWGLLNGNLNNDNNSQQMNASILNNSKYSDIYANNGVEYCTLLFSLASQPEFFTTFDNNTVQQSFSWNLFPLILEYMSCFSDSSFGSTPIQSI